MEAGREHLDAGSNDTSISHDVGALVDARRASSTDAGDARHDHAAIDTGIPGVMDASRDAGPGDAVRDGAGFCARYRPPPGASFVCDDFDEDGGWASLGANSQFVQPVAKIGVSN